MCVCRHLCVWILYVFVHVRVCIYLHVCVGINPNTVCFSLVAGGPLDLMSRRVVAAGSREMADYVVQQLQPISYERDDHDPSVLS